MGRDPKSRKVITTNSKVEQIVEKTLKDDDKIENINITKKVGTKRSK